MKKRVLSTVAVLAVVVGSVVGGASAASAAYLHGPYKTWATCQAVRAEVGRHVPVGDCFAMPKRGVFFRAG